MPPGLRPLKRKRKPCKHNWVQECVTDGDTGRSEMHWRCLKCKRKKPYP
jgi:hypothetical protein